MDQFEQVFTLLNQGPSGEARRQAFITALCAAAAVGPGSQPAAVVVIAVRADFWDRFAAYPELAGALRDGQFVVGSMTESDLRRAITGPADAAGLRIDSGLTDAILSDVRAAGGDDTAGALPLLSQAMALTWENRDGDRLTSRGYGQSGGVSHAVQASADAVYASLSASQQALARDLLRSMVVVSSNGRLTCRPVTRSSLCAGRSAADEPLVDTVLEAFAVRRLIVLGDDTAQIAHDALLKAWPRLRGWLEDEQASLILASQLAEDASTWRNNGDDPSFLYRGTQLAGLQQAARTWAADPDRYPRLISPQPEFLHASERAATRSARRARTRVTALIISLIVALSGLGIAAVADSSANQQRNDAITSQLAAQSELLDATDPVTAAQLAAAAQGIAPTFEARTSMLDVLAQPERAVLSSSGDIPLTGSVSVNAVAFSPDGKILAAAYNDGTARLWDVATHHQIGMPLIAHGDVAAVAFSPDGEILATADGDGARLWDVATHRQIGAFIIDSSPVTFNSQGRSSYRDVSGVVFSPDGDILATGDGNGTAQLWDVATHRQIGASMTVNPRGGIGVSAVAFSPDGDILATANGDGARLWDVATQREIGAPIIGSSGVVKSAPMIAVAFSPDGTLLATSELGGPVQLWNVVTHQQIGASFDNSDEIYGVAFSPGGTTMATAERGAARLWNVDIYRQIGASMTTGGSTIAGVAFNSHGTILATWSDDGGYGAAELWDVATHRQIGTPMTVGDQGVSEAPFHPDGTILATATVDGTARLWDVATHHQIGSPLKDSHGQSVTAIAFSPNGKILATADLDGITQLWDVATHRQIGAVITASHDLEISGLAFSPDGKILATGGWDGTARLWSVATHRQIGTPMIAGGFVEVAFSSDGKILATGGNDAVLCNVATHDQIGTPMAEDGSDVSVALNPQGTILATWNYLGQADLWDVATHSQIGPAIIPGGPGGGGVAFSPNGNILATGGNDATLLNVAFPRNLLPEVCSLAGRPLTLQQWNTFVQSIPYQQECSQYQSPRTESMPASGCDDRRLLKHNI